MPPLSIEEVRQKRTELLEKGFTVIPGVLGREFVDELKVWADGLVSANPPNDKFRYQGSDIHVFTEERWERREHLELGPTRMPDPMAARVIFNESKLAFCEQLGLAGLNPQEWVILISKPTGGPPCYWHQDFADWNNPTAYSPWPTKIQIGFYLTNTNRENGCMRVIPGSHQNPHELHAKLPPPHEEAIQEITDPNDAIFASPPDAIDIEVMAGDMVITDARLLHATWDNSSKMSRTFLVTWHDVFPGPSPPSWWDGEIPLVMQGSDPDEEYEKTKIPHRMLTQLNDGTS